jgi:NADH-quinone oxidoreductase subunit G/NADP-reducing hydrogenase subunit HndD
MMTGQELSPSKINDLRGMKEYKETRLKIGKQYLTAISVSGLANAIKVLDDIEAKKISPDILDVMACPIGCVNGGGQKTNADEKVMKARIKALYDVDDEEMIKVAHKSPAVSLVYEKMLGKPGSGQAIEMIHIVNPEQK